VAWLQQIDLIWLGGAPLSEELAARARRLGLRLAPCYGATETAAMVCALPPERFLAGAGGCGKPLDDVALRLDPASGALEIATERLSPGWLRQGRLVPLPRAVDGWWQSGDVAQLGAAGVQILGRLDGAILSGGETVFPDQVEQRLLRLLAAAAVPVAALLLLGEADSEWGERLVALVRPCEACSPPPDALLQQLALQLPPSQRPRRWLLCPQLERSATGKWERPRWQAWLAAQSG
jgi:O-succinylbenzoic acid--CoA ligase